MGCCSKNSEEDNGAAMEELCKKEVAQKPFTWHPTMDNVQQIAYVRRLECQLGALQSSYFNLSTQLARLQFRVRQIISAPPCNSGKLIAEIERIVFKDITVNQNRPDKLPTIEAYNSCLGDIRKKQRLLISDLREKIGQFPAATDEAFEKAVDIGMESRITLQPTRCEEPTKPLSNKSSVISQKQSAGSMRSSGSKSRKQGGSDVLQTDSSCLTTNTQGTVSEEASQRSISFQELRNMYQKKCASN